MSHIARLKETEIQDNNVILAGDLNAEFNQLVNNDNAHDDRLTLLEAHPGTVYADTITELTAGHGVRLQQLAFPSSALTISGGSITVSANNHTIDTEASAATDDLTNISGGAADGYTITLRTVSSARDVVIKHMANNIWLTGEADLTLNDNHQTISFMRSTSLNLWIQCNGPPPAATVPTGTVAMWCLAYTSPPTGWFVCNGGTISRTTYANLFALIGTTFGSGDGSTTFNLPDFRGRVPLGKDDGASRVTSASTGGSNANTIGGVGGAETHTLVTGEMPSHQHNIPEYWNGNANNAAITGSTSRPTTRTLNQLTDATGGGAAHSNTQPWLVINFMIKT